MQIIEISDSDRQICFHEMFRRLERVLIECDLEYLRLLPILFDYFNLVYKLTQEEKHLIFALIADFMGSSYIQLSKGIFYNKSITRYVYPILQKFSQNIQKKIELDSNKLLILMNQNMDKGIHEHVYSEQQRLNKQNNLQKFVEILRVMINPSKYEELLFEQIVPRVTKTEPVGVYIDSFKMMIDLKPYSTISRFKIQNNSIPQLTRLILNKPELPVDQHIQEIMTNLQSELFAGIWGSIGQAQQSNNRVREYVGLLVALIAPLNKFPKRIIVWELIEKIINLFKDFLHPSQRNQYKFIIDFVYQLVRLFFRRTQYGVPQPDLLKDQVNLYEESKNENPEDEEVEEQDDDEEDEDQPQLEFKEFQIGQQEIDKFVSIFKPLLKYIMLIKSGVLIASTIKYLVLMKPTLITDVHEQVINIFQRDDIQPQTVFTINSILERILNTYLDINLNPEGIKSIPFIIRRTSMFINDFGDKIWRFYDILYQYIPVYEIHDLNKLYPDVKQQLTIQAYDYSDITQEISDLSLEIFRQYVGTFEYIDGYKSTPSAQPQLVHNYRNKNYNFIYQLSESNFKEVINILSTFLDEKSNLKLNEQLINLLQTVIQRDPNQVKTFFPILYDKLIGHNEFNSSNGTIQSNYIHLIASIIQFGSVFDEYYEQYKTIINLSIKSDEKAVAKQGFYLLSSLIVNQCSIHQTEVFQHNIQWPLGQKQDNKYKVFHLTESKLLKQLLQDYYQQSLDFLQEILKDIKLDFSEYYKDNFQQIILNLNEPLCSKLLLQLDSKLRKKISIHLEVIDVFMYSTYIRAQDFYDERTSSVFKDYQKKIVLPVLDQIKPQTLQITDKFGIYMIQNGLSIDVRIRTLYYELIKHSLGESDINQKINRIRKWTNLKTNQYKFNKQQDNNKLKQVILANNPYLFKIQQSINQEDLSSAYGRYLMIWIVGFFLQDIDMARKCATYFNWYYSQLNNQLSNKILQDNYHVLLEILKSNSFNQQSIESLQESEKNQTSLFQKNFLDGLNRFVNTTLMQVGGQALDFYQHQEQVYQSIIDKTYRATFNSNLFQSQQNLAELLQEGILNEEQSLNHQELFIFHDEQIKGHVTKIRELRKQFIKQKLQEQLDIQQVNKQVQAFISQSQNPRAISVSGLALMYIPNHQLWQANIEQLKLATKYCQHEDYCVRSFGRALLLKLKMLLTLKYTQKSYIERKLEDYNVQIPYEEYMTYRGLLPQDRHIFKDIDTFTTGMLKPTTLLIDQKIEMVALKESLLCYNEFINQETSEELFNMFLLDMIVMENSQQQRLDYSNVYADISFQLYDRIMAGTKRSTVYQKSLYIIYQLVKFLFVSSDYKFYQYTKNLIDKNNLDDKDKTILYKLYYSALISAVHSKWPIDEQLKQNLIDDFFIYLDVCIEIFDKQEYTFLNKSIFYSFRNKDARKCNYFFEKLLQRILQNKDNETKLSRYLGIFYFVVEQKKFRQNIYLERLLNDLQIDFTQEKPIKDYLSILFQANKQMPHNSKMLNQFQINDIPQNFTQKSIFYIEHNQLFDVKFKEVIQQLDNPQARKNIVSTLIMLIKTVINYIYSPNLDNQFKELLLKLLALDENQVPVDEEWKEVNSLIYFVSFYIESTQIMQEIVDYVIQVLPSVSSKTRAKLLIFLRNQVVYSKQSINDLIPHVSKYLVDEQKQFQDYAFNLIFTGIQILSESQVEQLVEKHLTPTPINMNILVAAIMAHPRYIQSWTSKAIKVILQKCPELAFKQKKFAAEFMKIYKDNVIEDTQLDLELIEKMSDLSNPYNYFA